MNPPDPKDYETIEDDSPFLSHEEILAASRRDEAATLEYAQRAHEREATEIAEAYERLSDYKDDQKFEWQQDQLNQRIARTYAQSLVAMVDKRVRPSPEIRDMVIEKLGENIQAFSVDAISKSLDELIAEGRIQPDYSEQFSKDIHNEFESYRSKGVNLPAIYEKPLHEWPDSDVEEHFARGQLRDVHASEVHGLVELVNRGHAKRAAQKKTDELKEQSSSSGLSARAGSLAHRITKEVVTDEDIKKYGMK